MPAIGNAPAPRKLGPFTVGRKLGAGGMATVYAARIETAKRGELLALKVLSPNIASDVAEHRAFMREAAIATRLDHPNIVRTHHVAEHDGMMVLAMELVHGVPLGDVQKTTQGPIPIDIALRVTCDVARALHAAHELVDAQRGPLGLVHQDVSPHNILIGYDGVTKLVDFGVARLGMLEGSRTESLKGKPSYASPEQINGKNIDRRTDVFALGVVLWELLTGERLFRRETNAASYLAVLHDPIPDVRTKNPDVPEAIAKVVARALDRDRDARFPTAEAFRVAIDEARGERIPEASVEEVSFWIAQLAPPKLTFAELQRELEESVVSKSSSPLPPDAVVPDLDVPAPASRRGVSAGPASAPQAPPASTPARPAAPVRGPSIEVGNDADDFDMEIERDGSLASLAAAQAPPSSARRAPIAATASGLEVAHRRATAPVHEASDDEPSIGTKIAAYVVTAVVSAGAAAGLVKFAHRHGGRAVTSILPHAFDGTSAAEAGVVSAVTLVLAIVLGFAGLRMRPRSWAVVVSGGAMLLASLAMVTVTLVSTEDNPSPPDGALLLPYVVPLALLSLAVGVAGRATHVFGGEGVGRKLAAVPIAAVAGALAFLAVETSGLASLF